MRRLVRETRPRPAQLVLPVFVSETSTEIGVMSGVRRHTVEQVGGAVRSAVEAELGGIILFRVPDDTDKGPRGTQTWASDGIEQRAVTTCREAMGGDLVTVSDVCLDGFTNHGHYGFLAEDDRVISDETCDAYTQQAVAQARAGTRVATPSGVVDGQTQIIRTGLDAVGFEDVGILTHSTKCASTFYGPFRETVGSSLREDRRTCQQGPANRREGLGEALLDLAENADMVMIKPTSHYLNVLINVAAISKVPVAAYQALGKYAMIEATAKCGWIDRRVAIEESTMGIVRLGAEVMLIYWTLEIAEWLD